MSKIVANNEVGKNQGTYNRFFPYKTGAIIFGDQLHLPPFAGRDSRIPIVIARTIRPRRIES